MEEAIATSDSHPKRIYILISLNVVGVFACIATMMLLVLWAFNVIFPEPNTSDVLREFIKKYAMLPSNPIKPRSYSPTAEEYFGAISFQDYFKAFDEVL